MRVIVLTIVLLAVSVLGQDRAYWKFYSGYDCSDANLIGINIEEVRNPETRSSIECTNVEGENQSYKMDVGVYVLTQIQVSSEWIVIQMNEDVDRCGAGEEFWSLYAAQWGVCINYIYSNSIPTSFAMSSCVSSNPWNIDGLGSIVVNFDSNGFGCLGEVGTYPSHLAVDPNGIACLETNPESAPNSIAGSCPSDYFDAEPPVTPVSVPVAAPVDAPVAAPTSVPVAGPISIPVSTPSSGPTKDSASSSIMTQTAFVALGVTLSLL